MQITRRRAATGHRQLIQPRLGGSNCVDLRNLPRPDGCFPRRIGINLHRGHDPFLVVEFLTRRRNPSGRTNDIATEGATEGGKLIAGSRTADFVRLVEGRKVHLSLSGRTMEFDRDATCVAGC